MFSYLPIGTAQISIDYSAISLIEEEFINDPKYPIFGNTNQASESHIISSRPLLFKEGNFDNCDEIQDQKLKFLGRLIEIMELSYDNNSDNENSESLEEYSITDICLLSAICDLMKSNWLQIILAKEQIPIHKSSLSQKDGDCDDNKTTKDSEVLITIRCFARLDTEIDESFDSKKMASKKKKNPLYDMKVTLYKNLSFDPQLFFPDYNYDEVASDYDSFKFRNNMIIREDLSQLATLYASLESPNPDEQEIKESCSSLKTQNCLKRVVDKSIPKLPGFKTSLYHYQRNSLWKMMKREMVSSSFKDPDFFPCMSMDNRKYYIFLPSFQLLESAAKLSVNSGGILCENMGTGKTITCLALITQTLDQVSFPTNDEQVQVGFIEPVELYEGDDVIDIDSIPSLRDICMKSISLLRPARRSIESQLNETCIEYLESCPPFYLKDMNPTNNFRSKRESIFLLPPLKVYLSSATLIVTPDNLVRQWVAEIHKHLHDDALKFLVITENTDVIPPPETIVTFDLILMTASRFRRENVRGGLNLASVPLKCQCNYVGSSRVKDCHCIKPGKDRYISPLLQVQWLRMIVDEGHSMGAPQDNLIVDLASKLNANHFWACTGTPMPFATNDTTISIRGYQKGQNYKNYQRLKYLICRFLRIEPYCSKISYFDQTMNPSSSNFGNSFRLWSLMNEIMIRNSQEIVDKELPLPPCYEAITFLNFTPVQKQIYNTLIAFLKINMVLTEREGPDYIIQSPKLSQMLLENIRSCCFWVMTEDMNVEHLEFSLKNISEALQKCEEGKKNYIEEDKETLRKCSIYLSEVLHDPFWKVHLTRQSDLLYEIKSEVSLKEIPESTEDHQSVVIKHDELTGESNIILEEMNWMNALEVRQRVKEDTNNSESSSVTNLPSYSIYKTTSSKLSYLIQKLLIHQENGEKTLVFCQLNNEIYNIHEACLLSGIKCMQYHRKQSWKERAQTIVTFNTTRSFSTLIMDLKSAAFGVDLSTASRIYFTSPVSTPAELKQAIKRAHRNGCVKPVYVETLIIKESVDEIMLERQKRTNNMQYASQLNGLVTSTLFSTNFIPENLTTNFSFENALPVQYRERVIKLKENVKANENDEGNTSKLNEQSSEKNPDMAIQEFYPDELEFQENLKAESERQSVQLEAQEFSSESKPILQNLHVTNTQGLSSREIAIRSKIKRTPPVPKSPSISVNEAKPCQNVLSILQNEEIDLESTIDLVGNADFPHENKLGTTKDALVHFPSPPLEVKSIPKRKADDQNDSLAIEKNISVKKVKFTVP